jgi:hypothetical protein
LQDTGVDQIKFGAALTEDNLDSIRQSLTEAAEEQRHQGNDEAADELDAKADNVASIIGAKGSPFANLDEYMDFMRDPNTKKAIEQHIQLWQEHIEPQFKQARDIDPTVPLPSRGLNTGARINLKAVTEEDGPVRHAVKSNVGGASLTATFKRKTPFGIKARGTGQTYDINYQNIIRNTYERQLEIANKNAFDNQLVKTGNAVIDAPGQAPVLADGEQTVAFPISRKVLVTPEFSASQAKNIYVRRSLAGEYRRAANVDPKSKIPLVTPLMGVLNKAALAGFTDMTVHASNQLTALFNRPTTGKLFTDSLLSATGRADVPVTLVKAIMKSMQDNQHQMAELANIGALRQPGEHTGLFGFSGKILEKTDRVTRALLDDTFKSLVKEGLVPNTETARREYVNQIGQYNRRAQGPLMQLLRDTGFGPFATAGRTFNAMGIKMATLNPGTPATSASAAVGLRANVLSKWVGAAVIIGTMNYLLTKDKGGGMLGRPGTPFGNIDTGMNSRAGKQLSFPMASLLGVGRAVGVTGAKAVIDTKRLGLSNAEAFDAASRDIINRLAGPAVGPPVKFGIMAAAGRQPAVDVGGGAKPALPGESQRWENIKEALRESSPVYATYDKIKSGEPIEDIISTQLPRLAPTAGKPPELVADYPRIVAAAKANEYINYVVHETRRKPAEEQVDYATKQIDQLPPEFQKKAWDELTHRRVWK